MLFQTLSTGPGFHPSGRGHPPPPSNVEPQRLDEIVFGFGRSQVEQWEGDRAEGVLPLVASVLDHRKSSGSESAQGPEDVAFEHSEHLSGGSLGHALSEIILDSFCHRCAHRVLRRLGFQQLTGCNVHIYSPVCRQGLFVVDGVARHDLHRQFWLRQNPVRCSVYVLRGGDDRQRVRLRRDEWVETCPFHVKVEVLQLEDRVSVSRRRSHIAFKPCTVGGSPSASGSRSHSMFVSDVDHFSTCFAPALLSVLPETMYLPAPVAFPFPVTMDAIRSPFPFFS